MTSSDNIPVVKALGLTKIFRDFWGRPKAKAVNDIDFEVREGEILGLLGPNGSGKSTTVKLILGLLYPTAGNLSVLGKSPRDVNTKELIGYLPEDSYLYKYLTAEETLDFYGSLFGLSRSDRASRIDQLLEMVGLSHARKRRVGEFSKGMARRIGLAQAMINDPSFLVLDEPTNGLDPLGVREIKELILNLKRRGKTVLITSHLLSDLEDICDRVVILYGGKIRSEGKLDQLLSVSDKTEIQSDNISPEAREKIRRILLDEMPEKDFTITHPRRKLEDYFLEVVTGAQKENLETSGVGGAGAIADYLASDPLTALAEAEMPLSSPAVDMEAETTKRKAKKTATKLAELTPSVEDNVEKSPSEATTGKESLEEADRKLAELLENK